jgi:hypothetical protein
MWKGHGKDTLEFWEFEDRVGRHMDDKLAGITEKE